MRLLDGFGGARVANCDGTPVYTPYYTAPDSVLYRSSDVVKITEDNPRQQLPNLTSHGFSIRSLMPVDPHVLTTQDQTTMYSSYSGSAGALRSSSIHILASVNPYTKAIARSA